MSLKYISILSPSIWEATSIKYFELKLISKSWSNLTDKLSFPSPLLVLFTERFNKFCVRLNLTPSFLSKETEATLSTLSKNSLISTSSFFWFSFGITWT